MEPLCHQQISLGTVKVHTKGRAIASRRFPPAGGGAPIRVMLCPIRSVQCGNLAAFLRLLRFPLRRILPTAPQQSSSSNVRRWCDKRNSASCTKWTLSPLSSLNPDPNKRYTFIAWGRSWKSKALKLSFTQLSSLTLLSSSRYTAFGGYFPSSIQRRLDRPWRNSPLLFGCQKQAFSVLYQYLQSQKLLVNQNAY